MLLSLDDYKALRGIEDSGRDAALTIALEAADSFITAATGVDFSASGTAERDFEYNGSGILTVPYFTQLISLEIDGSTLGDELYAAGPPEGPPYSFISLAGRGASPLMGFRRNLDVYADCWWARSRSCRVTVTAEWGFPGGAPANAKMAAAILVDEFAPAEDGDSEGVVAKAIESYSVAYASNNEAAELPPQAAQLLAPYIRPRF